MELLTIDNVFDSIPLRWRMEQWPEEIRAFAAFLRSEWNSIPATHVLELGVRHGGTSALWHQLLPEAKVIGVDRIGHDSYHEPEFSQRARQMESEYSRYQFIEGDTSSFETLAKVIEVLDGGRVGFLFIDADHSYEAVSRDYERFGRMVVPNGLIAFHDIVDSPRTGGGVARLWSEFEDDRKSEFCIKADWGGIGVLRK
jgi:cephalosporin hydroxylase